MNEVTGACSDFEGDPGSLRCCRPSYREQRVAMPMQANIAQVV
eukprot:CAMPEP_0115477696 /NCGR_PEP_ID=MMETSP0271-20121206/55811_1 /TAXON_ID=71861 /ORGANISM="Scrippsiella trochoidea, Strain CCMP3099" /LENGTH=42 /DNA_ID= /DNA_START= /DNA_END= /DNA_ORIENTATION=